jgi:hypothetical protein
MTREDTREDDELRTWIDDWRAGEPGSGQAGLPEEVTAALIRRVKRRSLELRLLTLGELVLVAGIMTGLIGFAFHHPRPFDIAAMACLCLLAVGAVAFSFWNRRGLWSPAAETTAAYLALACARARRRREALRASRWLLAAETAVFIPWIWYRLHLANASPPPRLYLWGYGYLALMIGVMTALILGLERWSRREIAELEALERGD